MKPNLASAGKSESLELMNGDVRVWAEQDAIHLVAFDRAHHDPVELTGKMARALAKKLNEFADTLAE